MALKFCIIYPDNTIGTAYDYPLTGEYALTPLEKLKEIGRLLNVPDVCTSPDRLYHVDPETGSVNGAEPCTEELDNLYATILRQNETVDALILDNLIMTDVIDTLVLSQLEVE